MSTFEAVLASCGHADFTVLDVRSDDEIGKEGSGDTKEAGFAVSFTTAGNTSS